VITDESLKQQNRPEPLEKATHVTDNISELLLSIIHFTRARHKTLIKNIRNVNIPGFIPTDLPCRQFANQMNVALDSHQISNTLLMADTEHISFLGDGQFEVNSIPDPRAQELLDTNKEQYIQFEVDKIIENAVSQRFAAQLLREKEQSQAAPN
jgi:flagellar basal body rod protein FlgB